MNTAVLVLGGNIGDRFGYLNACCQYIESRIGKIIKKSAVYETAAWGRTNQQDYLNLAVVIKTKLLPSELLVACLAIEALLDRKREERWAERTVDVDIIFFNHMIISTKSLEIPHPRYHLRNFVLKPLADIIPEYVCPEFNTTILNMFLKCKDELSVRLVSEIDFALTV